MKGTTTLRRMLVGKNPRRTAWRLLLWSGLCILIFRFVLPPIKVQGDSMTPTFQNGSLHLSERISYLFTAPAPSDVVVIQMAGRHTMYLKRILAVPGDTIWFDHGQLYRNGDHMPEPYVVHQGIWTTPPVTLATNEYFVAGDYRTLPWQWHTMGRVDGERIAGKVWF